MNSCCQAIAIKESPRHRVGLATSTFYVFMDSGVGVGPLLLGFIIPIVGFRGLYFTLAVIVFASIFFVLCTPWKKETYRKQYPTGELVFKVTYFRNLSLYRLVRS